MGSAVQDIYPLLRKGRWMGPEASGKSRRWRMPPLTPWGVSVIWTLYQLALSASSSYAAALGCIKKPSSKCSVVSASSSCSRSCPDLSQWTVTQKCKPHRPFFTPELLFSRVVTETMKQISHTWGEGFLYINYPLHTQNNSTGNTERETEAQKEKIPVAQPRWQKSDERGDRHHRAAEWGPHGFLLSL